LVGRGHGWVGTYPDCVAYRLWIRGVGPVDQSRI
jgi:hypothetical protein